MLAQNGLIVVNTEVVLAVDVSASMTPDEQALQREGYVQALSSREFMQALKASGNGRISITYFEWANVSDQRSSSAWIAATAGDHMLSSATSPFTIRLTDWPKFSQKARKCPAFLSGMM